MNDKVKALSRNIEAIYPLAPMQQGLLFHSLMHPGKGMYLLQYRHVMVLPQLDLQAFRQAWAQVVERHELLRTSFVWKQQKRPMLGCPPTMGTQALPMCWLSTRIASAMLPTWGALSNVEQHL